MKKIIIGVTDCSKWQNYYDWLSSETVEVIKLSESINNIGDLKNCNGIILSGGDDVHPKFYGHPEWADDETLHMGIKEDRDEFEFSVIKKSIDLQLPVLGICRGLQLANVAFSGKLIPDLKNELKEIHSKIDGKDKQHSIKVRTGSLLNKILATTTLQVNSAHHQSADGAAEGLLISAQSPDGTIEAMELKDREQSPFFLLVQWHPERMADDLSSQKIKRAFIESCREKTR